ncbi:MAG: sodium:proton antiporter [Proteobacteria bacterium]|nr:sodium:proton antiporter [Pseudomonadota bacterium]
MNLPATAGLLVSLAALFAWLNHRYVKLPGAIGMMLIALALSVGVLALGKLGIHYEYVAHRALSTVDFDQTVMTSMLGFLLFAGALHVDWADLASERWPVAFLAVVGVVISTLLVGFGLHYALGALDQPIPLIWCLVFGALISPTDPIAVLAIIRSVHAPASLEAKVAGESLFNDGVGIVVFIELLALAGGERIDSVSSVAIFFAREALGGAAFGAMVGYGVYRLLRSVDNYEVEVLLTVALVMGGFAAASALHVSAPIAIVVAGLIIGNAGRRFAMSDRTRERIDTFWELIDSILNAVLFVLIGLELLVLPLDRSHIVPALVAIPVVLVARFVSVGVPAWLPGLHRAFDRQAVTVLTWGGLRGGISVALALSLPAGDYRQTIIAMTYACVLFSIVVQGLTLGRVMRAGERRRTPTS